MHSPFPVFDGHNDTLLRLQMSGGNDQVSRFLNGEEAGNIDLQKARAGGLAGGLCAAYVPSPGMAKDANGDFLAPSQAEALTKTMSMMRLLIDIERASQGALTICRTGEDLRHSLEQESFAAVFHIEGAEAVAADLDALYVLYEAGLRTLGPVWSRPNIFAYGVPFRFQSSPDIGPGLTESGKDLIRACNELGIMIDLSHMNEQGFWDIAKLSNAPLVASHSNAHVLCPHSRNLTDRQLDAIKDTGGLVGINFGVLFMREDGVKNAQTDIGLIARHAAYVAERIGVDHVALGSDFDGTTIPAALKDAAGLPRLIDALRSAGFNDEDLMKISHLNWISVLERSWAA
ncbi:dipeptidase [Oryzifoliimicrobium ureilyticus]|uniref:dipeptidase n=1 Tax=Oryzifoliimicrobium ureilyticus TaxID=3113724 RepID=UPI0030763F96